MRKFFAIVTAAVFSAPLFAADVQSVMLMYQAHEPGVGQYPSRILVTDRYVRMDDGIDSGDYLIFDRKRRLISSVTHDDETIFEIPAREVEQQPPMPLKLRTARVKQENAPAVAGKTPEHRQLYVNDTLCYSVVSIPGFMDDTVQALSSFRRVLAGEHAKVLPRLPADMQEPCDLTLNTFEPEWQLRYGLPMQEWDEKGNRQVLMDYSQSFLVDESLFELPEGYRHYDTDDL